MKSRVKSIIFHPLISGSFIVLVGSFVANIFNYLYNLLLGRFLSVSDYGLITSLVSLVVFFAVIQTTLTGIFAKFTASFRAREETTKFATLFSSGFFLSLISSIIIFIVLLSLSPLISGLLRVNDMRILLIIYLYISVSIFYSLPSGILQGEMKFMALSLINIISSITKIMLGIGLVVMGFKVFGAAVGVFASIVVAYVLGMSLIVKKLANISISHLQEGVFLNEFKKYSYKFFLATIGITIISSGDILLARFFLTPVMSGQYAALSLMAKSIFYLTSPIYFVFFPLIAHKNEKKESTANTLLLAGLMITGVSLSISIIYFSFPHLILAIFFPAKEYAVLASYLGFFSIIITIYSLAYLLQNFFLSIGRTNVYVFNLISGMLFILLVYFFHSGLIEIINSLFASTLLLFILLLVYYKNHGSK